MGTFSDDLKDVSSDLLDEFGESVTGSRVVEGSYNPSTGETASGSTTSYTGNGLPTNYTKEDIDGVNVLEDDTLLIFYSTTEPKEGDKLTFNNVDYNIQSVIRIRTQGVNILYKLQCRV